MLPTGRGRERGRGDFGPGGAGDAGEELERQLKRPAVFEELEETVNSTRRGVTKSRRVQDTVRKQVANLRKTRDQLQLIQEDLTSNLVEREKEIEQLQAEMARLQVEQQQGLEKINQVQAYEARVTQELKQQVDQLKQLNQDMDQVSGEYLNLFDTDTERKTVYLDYLESLLRFDVQLPETQIDAAKEVMQNEGLDKIRFTVAGVERLLDTYDIKSDEFNQGLNELIPMEGEVTGETTTKKAKRTGKRGK